MPAQGTLYIAGGGTGGHLYPGLAIADALVALRPGLDIMFIGAQRGIERTVMPTTRWRHELLDLHPLYRSAPWQNWRTIRGFASAYRRIGALMAERPPVGVLGTGGYAAGALLGYARLRAVPYFVQEQNALAGLTVRLFSPKARAAYLGFPEAVETLPNAARSHAFVTGNPITPPPVVAPDRAHARASWGFSSSVERVLLVFGGSQGSRAINDAASTWLRDRLPGNWGALWITGRNEYERLQGQASDRIRVVAYQQPMADAYAVADLAVARAGAMSTAELCAWGIPMILIPLPTAAADHQSQNASALAAAGAGRMIVQSTLASGALAESLDAICAQPSQLSAMSTAARARARIDASQVIASHMIKELHLQ